MIIVDNALKAREAQGKPMRVGMIRPSFMGRALVNQPGGRRGGTQGELDDAIRRGKPVVTEDPFLLCRSELVGCLVDVTGAVEFGFRWSWRPSSAASTWCS